MTYVTATIFLSSLLLLTLVTRPLVLYHSTQSGDTPFSVAVKARHLKAAELLLSLGATRAPGMLHYAVRHRMEHSVLSWLLSKGYSINEIEEVCQSTHVNEYIFVCVRTS